MAVYRVQAALSLRLSALRELRLPPWYVPPYPMTERGLQYLTDSLSLIHQYDRASGKVQEVGRGINFKGSIDRR